MKIYHNPRCSKSRKTLEIIEKKGVEPEIIKYLEEPPSKEELNKLIDLLGIKPEDLVRKTEKIYREKFKGKALTDEAWIDAMIQYPKLIQRPIVVKGRRAILGRPPENVQELL